MVRINGKSFRLFLSASVDVFIRGKAFERFESFREVIGHQEGLQMLFQVVMGLVVIRFRVASLGVWFMRSTWPSVQGWLVLVSPWSMPYS
jgi:hypothetical protein